MAASMWPGMTAGFTVLEKNRVNENHAYYPRFWGKLLLRELPARFEIRGGIEEIKSPGGEATHVSSSLCR